MKTSFQRAGALLLSGVFALSNPAWPQAAAQPKAQTAAPNGDFKIAQTTWHDVRAGANELDVLVKNRKLSSVHEAAFNLRDSVRELRFGFKTLPVAAQSKLDGLIRQVDALANELDESGDHNDLKGTVKNQRRLHVLLDEIAATFPNGALKPIGPLQETGPVKDPYCRMTVDPSTSAGRVAFNGQTYYFCSASEAKAFAKNPASYAALYDDLAFGKPKLFNVGLTTSGKVEAGHPAQLVFAVRENGKTAPVRDFQLVHTKLMHLIMVSDDLRWFQHSHPEKAADGRFYLRWTPPRAGRYWLYSDFTPSSGSNQIIRSEVRVGGATVRAMPHLTPDKTRVTSVDGYRVAVRVSPALQANRQSLLTYTISQNGQPVTDMQPYLGAMGHLMAIHQNGRDAVHTHVVGAGRDPQTGLEVTPSMATSSGPAFTYKLQLPAAGIYRVWAQFQRNGRVLTVPFTFQAQGDSMKTAKPKVLTALAASAAMTTAMSHSHAAPKKPVAPSSAKTAASARVQRVTISLPNGYKNGAATLKAGRRVALTFKLASDAGCGNTIAVPSAKWTKTLQVGQSATLVFTPKKSGPLAFACGMGMYKGTLVVR